MSTIARKRFASMLDRIIFAIIFNFFNFFNFLIFLFLTFSLSVIYFFDNF